MNLREYLILKQANKNCSASDCGSTNNTNPPANQTSTPSDKSIPLPDLMRMYNLDPAARRRLREMSRQIYKRNMNIRD